LDAQKAWRQKLPLDGQGLGSDAQSAIQRAPLEWVHGGRRDSLSDELELSSPIDLCDSIDELEVQRSVHDALMTVSVGLTGRWHAQQSPRRSP
jgi:hypothetical protein